MKRDFRLFATQKIKMNRGWKKKTEKLIALGKHSHVNSRSMKKYGCDSAT